MYCGCGCFLIKAPTSIVLMIPSLKCNSTFNGATYFAETTPIILLENPQAMWSLKFDMITWWISKSEPCLIVFVTDNKISQRNNIHTYNQIVITDITRQCFYRLKFQTSINVNIYPIYRGIDKSLSPQLSTNVLTLFLPHVPLEYLERQLSSRHDISFRTPL